jgi:hypothetical protein
MPLFVLLLIAIAGDVQAQTEAARTQQDMNDSGCAETGAARDSMQRMVAEIRRRYAADTLFVHRFMASQRAWEQFAAAQLAAIYPTAYYHRE